jgi:hypothetical protein
LPMVGAAPRPAIAGVRTRQPCPWPQLLCWELAHAWPELGARPCLAGAGAGSSPVPGRSWPPHPRAAAPSPGRQSSCAHATSPSRSSSRTSAHSSGRSSSHGGSRRQWPRRLAGAARGARGGSEAASLTTARGEQVAASGSETPEPLLLPRRDHGGAWPESEKMTFARSIHGAAARFLCRR